MCPLKYRIVKGVSGLVPSTILNANSLIAKWIEIALDAFVAANRIYVTVAKAAKWEFEKFSLLPCVLIKLKEFCRKTDRIDKLFSGLLKDNSEFVNLWHFIKMCLILSHGNAQVESGFSFEMLIENMHENSLVSLRLVYDYVLKIGGVFNVNITPSM